MKKGAILLMGLPGIGKGTQAFKLVKQFPNFLHFDTGAEIFRRINDPHFSSDKVVGEQKKVYEAGLLNDPRWVAKLVEEQIRFYAREGEGIIFSGSPRTLYEAKKIIPFLCEVYGKEHVLVLLLTTSEEIAKKRSLNRLVCDNPKCRYSTTKKYSGERCPNCGKKFPFAKEQKGEDWKISTFETRLRQFYERTLPALNYLRSLGLVEEINGEKSKEEIFQKVLAAAKQKFGG
ncbi:hypothetical protein COV28_01065 [candidate division WWE3 bacterium CG10_big_fil_rev_8_21_14_0_10_48_23]|uniref:Adenylate kinase n=1 Tax=candidate division WWE3 bacterium CG_4_9_14_0_2_um_filter_48_10 TaxID=1975078 RepID=A0A2M8EKG9_UNCKA|nr:MAG: hypothetical protein CO059_00015 [candidate division WWE3 bacterium CG_4_9_14_0_2_um_filter_48_10]PJE52088.1 MAG: hypothetical protein COV28_01065 [candidate division WWE3 bacterium CG10_big_fil_rev_8_21_14_0_10_48_23]